eukprot:1485635-Rhodomonas_salina.1
MAPTSLNRTALVRCGHAIHWHRPPGPGPGPRAAASRAAAPRHCMRASHRHCSASHAAIVRAVACHAAIVPVKLRAAPPCWHKRTASRKERSCEKKDREKKGAYLASDLLKPLEVLLGLVRGFDLGPDELILVLVGCERAKAAREDAAAEPEEGGAEKDEGGADGGPEDEAE